MSSVIAPYPMRSMISEEAGELRISIPMRRRPVLFLFMVVWLSLWTVGGIAIGRQLEQKFNLFEALWMVGWAIAEVFATYALLRMLAGRDIVRFGQGVIELRKEVFGWGVSRRYSLPEIREMRFQPESGGGKSHRDSSVAFDYGAKTITFGDGIDEAEANQLIRVMTERYKISETASSGFTSTRFWQAK